MPTSPEIHDPPSRSGPFLYSLGLALMAANRVRRFLRPYDRPRPWSAKHVDRSVNYVLDVVRNWESGFRSAGIDDWLEGRSVLETGPGPDLGTGLVLLARGARSYLAVDRFLLIDATPETFYEALFDRLSGEPRLEAAREAYERFKRGDPEGMMRYALLPEDPRGAETPAAPRPDLWLSQAALEHVDDLPRLLRLLSSWCDRETLALHHVDAATHTPWIREADPLNILRYQERLYRALSFPGSPNRWRSGRYVDCFRSLGWDLLDHQPVHRLSDSAVTRLRRGIVEPFRSMDDEELGVFSFRLILRREGRS